MATCFGATFRRRQCWKSHGRQSRSRVPGKPPAVGDCFCIGGDCGLPDGVGLAPTDSTRTSSRIRVAANRERSGLNPSFRAAKITRKPARHCSTPPEGHRFVRTCHVGDSNGSRNAGDYHRGINGSTAAGLWWSGSIDQSFAGQQRNDSHHRPGNFERHTTGGNPDSPQRGILRQIA